MKETSPPVHSRSDLTLPMWVKQPKLEEEACRPIVVWKVLEPLENR